MNRSNLSEREDFITAKAFSDSWENLYSACPYSDDQVVEWLAPVDPESFKGKKVLEMGCGSGALLHFVARQNPEVAVGMDLGTSVRRAQLNLRPFRNVKIVQDDMTNPGVLVDAPFDVVYCIGVLHHLKHPEQGFNAILNMTATGGRFHCWVYAREGNACIRLFVEPLRKIVCQLPWYLTKYAVALPLSVPFYLLSRGVALLSSLKGKKTRLSELPLYDYLIWISKSAFRFHHHVAFDQLVSPQTHYVPRDSIEEWLSDDRIEKGSTYIYHRNKNGWKFGGIKKIAV